MRLKQTLTTLLAVLVLGAVAVAAGPQLTNVSVVGQGTTTTVTLRATGAFTHNEYRPGDNELLINLEGVSAGKLQDQLREVQAPGLKSYRVVSFQGAGGVQIARVELALLARPQVRVTERKGEGLVVEIISTEAAVAAQNTGTTAPAPAALKANSGKGPAELREVNVIHGKDGIEIQLSMSTPVSAKTMQLTGPNRVVVDLPNTLPVGLPKIVKVNEAAVQNVRVGRFQENPPVTRVVVDLSVNREFDLVASGNNLVLKPRSSVAAAPKTQESIQTPKPVAQGTNPGAPPVVLAAAQTQPEISRAKANVEPEYKGGGARTAQDFVVLEPQVQERTGNSPDPEPDPDRLMAANNAPVSTPALSAPLKQAPVETAPVSAQDTKAQTPGAPLPVEKPVNFAAEQRKQSGQGTIDERRYTGEPISVKLKDADLRDFFLLISEISGLNVVVDPTISGALTIVLNDVPWDQALDIVLKNNGLDRELEGNVLRVASVENLRKEAEARRKQLEAQALAVEKVTATRFLSYAHAKDVLPTLKRLLSSRGDIVADERTNALVIEDIPSVIPGMDRLIVQLDRKTQEVEIEARVVAATRTFVRDIGTQFAFGFGNNSTAVGGNGSVGDTGVVTSSPRLIQSQTTTGAIPLFSNLAAINPTSGLSFVNKGASYRVDTYLTMAESRGLLKILSRPRVITQNNIQAIVKQGQRIPIVTLGQLGGPPTVAYIEAVLRLTVTPQITAENTIFLNVDIENTTPDFSNKINGNPVFLTQQTTTSVLVTNGGTVVIGGVLQSQNSLNVNQVPYLGSVPILGNLFKRRGVNTATQELIFFLTPRIVES